MKKLLTIALLGAFVSVLGCGDSKPAPKTETKAENAPAGRTIPNEKK